LLAFVVSILLFFSLLSAKRVYGTFNVQMSGAVECALSGIVRFAPPEARAFDAAAAIKLVLLDGGLYGPRF